MPEDSNWMARVADALITKRLELEAKDLPDEAIEHAISRAWGTATKTVTALPESLRDEAFPYFLERGLRDTEKWINGTLRFVEGAGESESEEEGGE